MTPLSISRTARLASTQDAYFHVEFFGLPGSGKTTIAREVYTNLVRTYPGLIFAPKLLQEDAGVTVRTAAKLRLILSDLCGGSVGFHAVKKAFAIRQECIRDKVRAVFTIATVASLYKNIQRRRLGAVVDQGLLQALWSVYLRAAEGSSGTMIASTLKVVPYNRCFYVSVETSPEICANRLASRVSRHSRMQETAVANDHGLWETAEQLRLALLGNLRDTYKKQGIQLRIIMVDGTKDPVNTAEQIVESVIRANSNYALRQFKGLQGAKA